MFFLHCTIRMQKTWRFLQKEVTGCLRKFSPRIPDGKTNISVSVGIFATLIWSVHLLGWLLKSYSVETPNEQYSVPPNNLSSPNYNCKLRTSSCCSALKSQAKPSCHSLFCTCSECKRYSDWLSTKEYLWMLFCIQAPDSWAESISEYTKSHSSWGWKAHLEPI